MKINPASLIYIRFLQCVCALASAVAISLLPATAQTNHPGNPLRIPPAWSGGVLRAAPSTFEVWPGIPTPLLAINGSIPNPTIRVQKGSNFVARVENRLSNNLVMHWHGIIAPPSMDGHPNDAILPGQDYNVDFTVRQRAGTYFYHPHTEPLTGNLVYRGLAGAFIVEDAAEQSLGLPSGDRDVVMLIQDKHLRSDRQLVYEPSMVESMMGYLGDTVLVNATPDAYLSVGKSLYRLRLINGSNARVYKLGFGDGRSFQIIATDSGLLSGPLQVTSAFLAPGERLEIVVDFTSNQIGDSVLMQSIAFDPATMASMESMCGTNTMSQLDGMASMTCSIDMTSMMATNTMTMKCTGMVAMMGSSNCIGMDHASMMGQLSVTGTMTCMMSDMMLATNGMSTMSCTGMLSVMSGSNFMMTSTMMGQQMPFTGMMTCMVDPNMMMTGMGTMSCTGMIAMMLNSNMICGTGTNQMGQIASSTGGMMDTNGMGMTMTNTQGLPLDIIRFYVDRDGTGSTTIPTSLSSLAAPDPTQARRTRTFTLGRGNMVHTINGTSFSGSRVDFQVPYGEFEIWEFRNTTDEIHPMHPHGALFQVLSRNGNTNIPPENLGWKDTVLVWPNETVRVLIRFDAYAGLFVSHCHNLEHEDSGMMQNFEVNPARLAITKQLGGLAFTYDSVATNYVIEASTNIVPGSTWTPISGTMMPNGGNMSITISNPPGNRFYRLVPMLAPSGSTTSGGDPHAGHH